jgi:hypothetical protein
MKDIFNLIEGFINHLSDEGYLLPIVIIIIISIFYNAYQKTLQGSCANCEFKTTINQIREKGCPNCGSNAVEGMDGKP